MLKELAYYDGVYGTPEEVKVPFNDRVHFFGDGVYDATVGANGKVYLLQDHLDRFYSSAKALDIRIPMEKTELGSLLTGLLARVEGSTHFVYWQVTRGVNDRDHTYPDGMPGKLWVMIRPNHLNDPDKPIKLVTRPDTRFYHCNIKTLNLIPSVMAAEEAKRLGVQETVFHRGGIVTECAHSNVSILKNGGVLLPPQRRADPAGHRQDPYDPGLLPAGHHRDGKALHAGRAAGRRRDHRQLLLQLLPACLRAGRRPGRRRGPRCPQGHPGRGIAGIL